MKGSITIEEILGPWEDPEFDSSLIQRCREAWSKPIKELTNQEISTFLRQKMVIEAIAPIAKERIASGVEDGTEAWDNELQQALDHASK